MNKFIKLQVEDDFLNDYVTFQSHMIKNVLLCMLTFTQIKSIASWKCLFHKLM